MKTFIAFMFHFFFVFSLKNCISPIEPCPFCSYNNFDAFYRSNFYLKLQNVDNCFEKNRTFSYKRAVFIFNSSENHDLYPDLLFDANYSSLIQAFEQENYLIQEYLNGQIKFTLEDGDHFILKKNLKFDMEELFRRSLFDIIIKPFRSFANIILKTNDFYLFISSSFFIENINIYANDLILQIKNESDSCLNSLTKFCCNKIELKDDYSNETNLCSLTNYKLQTDSIKKKNYGLFNLEFMFDQIEKIPELIIKNCKFYNLFLIDMERGFSSLISLAPFSGSLTILSSEFINLFTPKGLIYYSSLEYDEQFYSNSLFTIIENNLIYKENILKIVENITFISNSINDYNNYEIINFGNMINGVFSFSNFKGFITIHSSRFTLISFAFNLFRFENDKIQGALIVINSSFYEIFNTKLFTISKIEKLSLIFSEFYSIPSKNDELGKFSSVGSILFSRIIFEKLSSIHKTAIFLIESCETIIKNNTFIKFYLEYNLFYLQNSTINIEGCIFFDLYINDGLFFAQNLNHFEVLSSKFQNLIGKSHLIYGDNVNMVNIYSCLFKNISNYNIFELDTVTYFNFTNSSILSCSIVFVVNRDLNAKYMKFLGGEISNNSILKGILWKNNILYFDSIFESIKITHNNYSYQALFRIYSANHIILDKVSISFNFFLSPDSYCCVMDFENTFVQVWNSYFQSNGLIKNPIARPRTLDSDCFFDFYYNDFNEFFNNVFVGDRHTDMTGGFLCCATCGKYLFVENNTFLVLETNPKFGYKGMLMDFSYITLKNLSFWNIPGSLNNFYFKNGALLFYASTSYFYKENENVLVMENLNFYNCSSHYGGGLVIISYKTVILKNCSFFNNSAKFYGGNFGLIAGKNVTLDSIYIESSEASFASGAYIKTIDLISIKNLEINSSFSHGIGVIYLRDINIAKLEKVRSQSTYSLSNGGLFFLFNVHLIINDLYVTDSSSSAYGGVFYLDFNSDINIDKTYCKNVRADEAGGFISLNSAMNVSISNTHIMNVSSLYGGVFSFLLLVKNVIFKEILIENSYSENGVGLSVIKTYDDTAKIKFESVKSINCSAVEGSFLYFLSNSQLYLKNITVMKNLHNCIYISYTFQIKVYLESLFFYECEVSSSQHLFNLHGLKIEINGLVLENNFDGNSFISAENSEIYLFDISFKNNTNYSMFSLRTSQLLGMNITSTENDLFFLYSVQSTLRISECSIKNSKTLEGYDIFNIEEGQVRIENSIFANNLGLIIKLLDCDNAVFFNVSFLDNFEKISDNSKPNDIYFLNTNLENINNITIEESYFSSKFGGISTWIAGFNNLNINKTNFNGSKRESNFGEMALFISETNSVIIQNSNFTSYYGNAIQGITQTNNFLNLFQIENCTFTQNKGFYGSCLLLNGDYNVYLLSNAFENNLAILDSQNSGKSSGIAPVLFFECGILSNKNCNLSIVSCNFKNNQAQFIAPTIFTEIPPRAYQQNIYQNNQDSYSFTNNIFSYPLKIVLLSFSSQESKLNDRIIVSSGIPFNMTFEVRDYYNNKIVFDNETLLTIKSQSSENNNIKIDKNIGISMKGKFSFENLAIYGLSNQNLTLEVAGRFMAGQICFHNHFLFLALIAFIRPCLPGEIIINDESCKTCSGGRYTCSICKPGYYSFIDPMKINPKYQKCLPCMANAHCFGGNQVYPGIGYYKLEKNSTYMIKCNTYACLGYVNFTNNKNECDFQCQNQMVTHGLCQKGNFEVLCFYCEKNYGKYDFFEKCINCDEISNFIILRWLGFFIFIFINNFIMNKKNVEAEESEINSNFDIFFKIFVNHNQQVGILLSKEIVIYSSKFRQFLNYLDFFSLGNDYIMSNSCVIENFYDDPLKIHLTKAIFVLLMPFIFGLGSWLIWVCPNLFLNKMKMRTFVRTFFYKMLSFIIISVFLFYPLIMRVSISFFQCQSLDINVPYVYMKHSPKIQCWTSESNHIYHVFFFGIPSNFVWGILFPYILYIFLKRKHETFNQTKNPKKIIKFSGTFTEKKEEIRSKNIKFYSLNLLSKGYKFKFYYWECLIFVRKFLMNLFISLNQSFPNELANSILILVISFFFAMNLKKEPFINRNANKMENFSLLICLLTVLISFLFELAQEEFAKLIFLIICFVFNLVFLAVSFFIFLFEGIKIIKSFNSKLIGKLSNNWWKRRKKKVMQLNKNKERK